MKLVFSLLLALAIPTAAAQTSPTLYWYKGNTHTHTTNSDGDSSPSVVARWYRDAKYDFLVLSDHNKYTEILELQREIDSETSVGAKKFLLIPGEEVSNESTNTEGRKVPLHLNGLNTTGVVGKQHGANVVDTLQRAIDAIHAKGGIPHVNHPNFGWALTADDLIKLRGLRHFEIFNAHPAVNNLGGGGKPGVEEIWDMILSSGRQMYGVAVDDAHNFKKFSPSMSNPGLGWIFVRAPELTPQAIIHAFEKGEYYCSTGVVLTDLHAANRSMGFKIRSTKHDLYTTHFIGKNGAVLHEDITTAPAYQMKPTDAYVRARVRSSSGHFAWTQPLFSSGSAAAE